MMNPRLLPEGARTREMLIPAAAIAVVFLTPLIAAQIYAATAMQISFTGSWDRALPVLLPGMILSELVHIRHFAFVLPCSLLFFAAIIWGGAAFARKSATHMAGVVLGTFVLSCAFAAIFIMLERM